MCTVTFIPLSENKNDFVFTSNRDENLNRNTIAPKIYIENKTKMIYPKDKVAGGTWIGASEKKRLICLMNGAFSPHQPKDSYKKSRGVVVKDLLVAEDVLSAIEAYDFKGIEAFTMIIVDFKDDLKLYELIWDERQQYFNLLKNLPHIWSASMTYSNEMKAERKKWFNNFLERGTFSSISAQDMWKFHHEAGAGDKNIGFIIDRGILKTTSITQFLYRENKGTMRYVNLLNKEESSVKL